jgi:S1-C subfamily serine protease
VVRWRTADGKLETRIVTNNHVMAGAFEAEIVSGDPELASKGEDPTAKRKGWSAVLIQANPNEDVAILRLEAPAVPLFRSGLKFRLTPAAEEEQVVAAGFPGVGARPSFQVSRGVVSNATFGGDEEGESFDAYVQHTAAIDPGNSGGPLLDGEGQLLGMNTLKIVGRENVGLAVPTLRIQEAMVRAEEPVVFDVKHAEASCNAVVSALSSAHPVGDAMSRFGLPVFEATKDEEGHNAAEYRSQVQAQAESPVEQARLRAYGAVRARVEDEGGVMPFATCSNVKAFAGKGASARYLATMQTRTAKHELVFAEENGAVRLVEVR